MMICKFFKKAFKKKPKHEPREIKGQEIPSPEIAPAPFNIIPKNVQPIGHIYPRNWKYIKDPDAGDVPLAVDMPAGVVIHHTVTYNLNSTVSYFKRNKVDVHFLIGHDGKVVQMVDCNKKAAHAGKSSWGKWKGLNDFFVGIEIVNLGPLTQRPDGTFIDAYNRPFSGSVRKRDVFGYKYWEACPQAQEKALIDLCAWLISRYGMSAQNVIAHFEASPGRKIDPAGALSCDNMDEFRGKIVIASIKQGG